MIEVYIYPGIQFIGDEVTITPSTVRAYKKKVEEEIESILDSDDNLWKLEAVNKFSEYSLTIESRRVEGTLGKFSQPGERKNRKSTLCFFKINNF